MIKRTNDSVPTVAPMVPRSSAQMAAPVGLWLAFILFTVAVGTVDREAIGPDGSVVGLAAMNRLIYELLEAQPFWYALTDWLGLVPVAVACGFACLGAWQLVRRRSLRRVDADIMLLGALYLAVVGYYVLFERLVVNYRPILIGGRLEASYPSSHTMVAVGVMATAVLQFRRRTRSHRLLAALELASAAVIAVTALGRLISGAHWLSDIIGGLLLGSALAASYRAALARRRSVS
ncbi:MAG TPA: phosphatase PAP2 family protein, partial [Spirochaetales bacterium]|nr:phosphatase PAP2 family protein [Spirochaetales bacterium]